MLTREQLYSRIQWSLVTFSEYLKLNSSQNFNSPAVILEDTCVRLLNLVFGHQLTNLNAEVANAPAADLICRDGRIAFQITINDTPEKVSDTHVMAAKGTLAKHVDKLTLFFFVRKAPADPGVRAKFTRCTAPKIDKLDLTGLMTHVRSLKVEHVRAIADLLKKETVAHIGQPPRLVPAICNFPFDSLKDLFIGRADFLAGLHQKLTAGGTTVIRGKQAIHGMGGVGKTRAAIEYGWAHAADYGALLFLSADSPEALDRNLAALCDPGALDLPEQKATETEAQIAAVHRWLAQTPGWLLILDNVDSPAAQGAVAKLAARIPHGHILITGRLADWPTGFAALDLGVLDEPNSIRLLLAHTAGRRTERPDDSATAAKIARHLDGLALALEQAAAWVRQDRRTLAAYLAGWLKILQADSKFIFKAAAEAQKAADYILNRRPASPQDN